MTILRVTGRWIVSLAASTALLLGCDTPEPRGLDAFWGSGAFQRISTHSSAGGRFNVGSRIISADLNDGMIVTWTTDSVFWHDAGGSSGIEPVARAVPEFLGGNHLGRVSVVSATEALWVPSGGDRAWVLPTEADPYPVVGPGCIENLLDGTVSPDGSMVALLGLSEGGQLAVTVTALAATYDNQTCLSVAGLESFRWLPAAFIEWDGDQHILLAPAFPRVAIRYRVALDAVGPTGMRETWRFQPPEWVRDDELAFRGDPAVVREWALRSGMLTCAVAARGITYLCHGLPDGMTEVWCMSVNMAAPFHRGRLSPNPANLLSESQGSFLMIQREIDQDVLGVFTPHEGEEGCEP